jgi:VanZ family protein
MSEVRWRNCSLAHMRHPAPAIAPRLGAALVAGVVALILYGSLYPFLYQPLPTGRSFETALTAALWHTPSGGRGDVIANLLLYMPLGGAVALALRGRWPAEWALLIAALGSALLAFGVEATQLVIVSRTTSGWDLLLNTLGSLLGATSARLLSRLSAAPGRPAGEPFALLLLIAWLGYGLYPYVPHIDLQGWWRAVKPLMASPMPDPLRLCRLTAFWLLAAELATAATGGRPTPTLAVPSILLGTLAAKVLIVDNGPTSADVAAVAIVLPTWVLLRGVPVPRRARLLLPLLLTALLIDRLEPFRFGPVQVAFGWVPFRGILASSGWSTGVLAGLQKFFLYGGALWLLRRAGTDLSVAVAAVFSVALGTSAAQIFLPGRSAEITDALIALGAAATLVLSKRLQHC